MKLKEKLEICNEVLEYLQTVTEKQGRVLPFETMLSAYKATFGKEKALTDYGFKCLYDSYIEALIEQDVRAREKEGK